MASHAHLIIGVNNAFSYKNQEYLTENITYLDFFYVVTQKKYNLRQSGKDHSVNIKIGVKNRSDPIDLSSGPKFLSLQWMDLGEDSSRLLIKKYDALAKSSFPNRIKGYLDQVKESGFFWYDGKRIGKNGIVSANGWSFDLKSGKPLYRQPFAVYQLTSSSFKLFRKKMKISTVRDPDCFAYLLKYFYGLSFE